MLLNRIVWFCNIFEPRTVRNKYEKTLLVFRFPGHFVYPDHIILLHEDEVKAYKAFKTTQVLYTIPVCCVMTLVSRPPRHLQVFGPRALLIISVAPLYSRAREFPREGIAQLLCWDPLMNALPWTCWRVLASSLMLTPWLSTCPPFAYYLTVLWKAVIISFSQKQFGPLEHNGCPLCSAGQKED